MGNLWFGTVRAVPETEAVKKAETTSEYRWTVKLNFNVTEDHDKRALFEMGLRTINHGLSYMITGEGTQMVQVFITDPRLTEEDVKGIGRLIGAFRVVESCEPLS